MLAKDPLRVLYCSLYLLAVSMSSPRDRDDSNRDVIEHIFKIPNPDRVLKSVFGRLQKIRQHDQPRERMMEEIGCEQPYYYEKFYPICHLERKIRKINSNEFEYRPSYYEEVQCSTSSDKDIKSLFSGTNEICSSLGFSCVQWNKTIHLTRRHYSSDCWETRTMVIPAGCECMWPFHQLGDISYHM